MCDERGGGVRDEEHGDDAAEGEGGGVAERLFGFDIAWEDEEGEEGG